MGPYLTRFSIRDLEEFSGVKAHTIRIWERRYGLLEPDRTDTNIRTYSVDELKTILNVAFLNRHGVKISKVAALSKDERESHVKELAQLSSDTTDQLNTLKLAMVSYDTDLFESTSEQFRKEAGFRALIERLYVPLLEHIGVLWQSNAICPAQEHFVSYLVRQKLVVGIDSAGPVTKKNGALFVLYLPEDEIHELGLLYTHYLLRTAGERVLYLGQSVPIEDLAQVAAQFPGTIEFISIFTAFPQSDGLPKYLESLRSLMPDPRLSFRFTGSRVAATAMKDPEKGIRLMPHFKDLLASLA
ncbi:MAG: MerR family transcriptional regulator [Flavobacteriales bacterium]|nr:MerR family transcriptional regulator [Flavobacteriales bacterium]MBL0044932.1 MerR family transcriptional regulator [Flavobacteriales bacterium]